MFELKVVTDFAAAHQLKMVAKKCENLHGHNYKLIITIEGQVQEDGMVMDFKLIKEAVNEEVVDILDHTHLNDRLPNPSAENLAVWIWDKLKGKIPVVKVAVYETDDYVAEYTGE